MSRHLIIALSLATAALVCCGPASPEATVAGAPSSDSPLDPPERVPSPCAWEVPATTAVIHPVEDEWAMVAVRAPTVVRADPDDDAPRVTVAGALRFEARLYDGAAVLAEDLDAPIGRFVAGTQISALRSVREGVQATLQVDNTLIEVGTLRCGSVRIGALSERTERPVVVENGTLFVASHDELVLRPEPNHHRTYRLRRGYGPLPLFVLGERGPWSHVQWRWEPGAEIDGWVPSHDLTPPSDESRPELNERMVRPASESAEDRLSSLLMPADPPEQVEGDTFIERGTTVYFRAGQGPWAVVVEPGPYQVRERGDPEYVQVTAIRGLEVDPGVDVLNAQAWVLRTAIRPVSE